jgi:hypothetical protein
LVKGLPVAHHRGEILAARHKVFERLASELVLPGLIFAGIVRHRGSRIKTNSAQRRVPDLPPPSSVDEPKDEKKQQRSDRR